MKNPKKARLNEERKEISISYPNDIQYQDTHMQVITLTGIHGYSVDDSWYCSITVENIESLIEFEFDVEDRLVRMVEDAKQKSKIIVESDIPGLKGELFNYQKEGVAYLERKNGRALINDEMGLGKTVQVLAYLQRNPEKRPVIVIVPKSIKLNWKYEAEKWMENPMVEVIYGIKKTWKPTGEIIIIDYEILDSWVEKLRRIGPKVLIIDEIHYMQDSTANHTKAVKKLGRIIPHIIGLAGKSVVAHPIESFNALKLINPSVLPYPGEYAQRYGERRPSYFGWESYGSSTSNGSFDFKRSEEKVVDFMKWLQEQVNNGMIEIAEINQVGEGIESEWTNMYISNSYKRKEMISKYDTSTIMSTPFHIDRVGVIFSRVFKDMPGITEAMDIILSRILAQGMADGDNPTVVARKIMATLTGTGLKDSGVTDSFTTESIDKYISLKRRVRMIAHTEMMRAFHLSHLQDYRNWNEIGINIKKVEWRTATDNRVCDLCHALEGKEFLLDDIENMIPLHPECRCHFLPIIEGQQSYRTEPKKDEAWLQLKLREELNDRQEFSHLEELYGMLTHTMMIRRLKRDVLKDLPKKIYSFIPIELDNAKEYIQAENEFIAQIKQKDQLQMTGKRSNTHLSAYIEKLIQLAIKGKFNQTIEWIRNFLEVGSKLIVFSSCKFVIEALIHAFPEISVKVEGSDTSEIKQRAEEDFQTKPEIRLFIGQTPGATDGLSLNKASNIAFIELPWPQRAFEKEEDCCHSSGLIECINIYYLFGSNTIEEKIAKIINRKRIVFDSVIDEAETEASSLISELMKQYE